VTRVTGAPPTRLAVVGCGRMGRRHIAAAVLARGVSLVAVSDPAPGAAASAAPPGVEAVEDAAGLLARGDVDAVVIAAPTPLHVALCRAFLEAGTHVLVEKPVGFDPGAIRSLGVEAEGRALTLAVGYWRRHAWPYRRARELLDAGAIGDPQLVRACQWDATSPPASFCDPAISGGIEIDCGVHELDVAAWLLGSPLASVAAAGTSGPDPAVEAVGDVSSAVGLVTTASGRVATIDLARTAGYDDVMRTEVVGSAGVLLLEAGGAGSLQLGDEGGLRSVAGPEPAVDVWDDALVRQLEAFARACRGGAEPDVVRAAAAAANLEAGLAFRAARLSGTVEHVGG
jgi:myo-inositol 2-dehydrogenase/D-chiro-inositol 1-dehydrogenase